MRDRAALVGLVSGRSGRQAAESSLDELAGLVSAAGGVAVLRSLQERGAPDAATFVGKGKLEMLALACDEQDVTLVVFDHELTPTQLRQIEPIVGQRVIDRTQLILDIFARRARTREGKSQVELAQLRYLLPRLVGAGLELSRLGGGIGTRGPGETKLETDRRRIRQRIATISSSIEQVRERRARLRERRHKSAVPTIALVGYTNAGKTTVFNLLTGGAAEASDALFVTLDPLVRQIKLPDRRELLVSDTVGFIDRLPHTLVAAFRATLEEARDADLLVHVIDAAAPGRDQRIRAVEAVLDEIDASAVPRITVLNKADLLAGADLDRALAGLHDPVVMSALHGQGRDDLLERVTAALQMDTRRVRIKVDPNSESGRRELSWLYRHSRVLRHDTVGGRSVIDADVPARGLAQFPKRNVTSIFGSGKRRSGEALMAIAVAVWLGLSVACATSTAPPPAPAAPAYAEFLFPQPPDSARDEKLAALHRQAWRLLQSGDLRGASVQYTALIKSAPNYVAAEVGLGYVLLAQQKIKEAMLWFDHALLISPKYAPAMAGRAEGYLSTGQRDLALASYEAALKLDPRLSDVSRRLEVIRFARIRELMAAGKRAADEGRLEEARTTYAKAIQSWPDSAVLYRDLGLVEIRLNALADAVQHLKKAAALDASDARALLALGEALEKQGDADGAFDAYDRADRVESTDATRRALARLKEGAANSRLPAEYRAISRMPQISRGDFAALLGVRLQSWLLGNKRAAAVVATDVRGHWAASWILAVVRAGVMDVYANHTFQPAGPVRRIDAAHVVARVVTQANAAQAKVPPGVSIGDVGPDHLGYADVVLAVSSGVMELVEGGQFRPSSALSGTEAIEVVDRLERLTKKPGR